MAMLNIDINITTEIINTQFNTVYPFLRIGFFREAHVNGKSSRKNKMLEGAHKLEQLKRYIKSGFIEFNGNTTVWELENNFETNFGLHVQVFRKSGNIWLETTATDNWTLDQQNDQGKYLDEELTFERENPDDHDIY